MTGVVVALEDEPVPETQESRHIAGFDPSTEPKEHGGGATGLGLQDIPASYNTCDISQNHQRLEIKSEYSSIRGVWLYFCRNRIFLQRLHRLRHRQRSPQRLHRRWARCGRSSAPQSLQRSMDGDQRFMRSRWAGILIGPWIMPPWGAINAACKVQRCLSSTGSCSRVACSFSRNPKYSPPTVP